MGAVDVTLIGKPGCHLCDDARSAIADVREACRAHGIDTVLHEQSILDDERLARKHSEDIPVVLVNGRRVAVWRVDPARLTRAIEKAAARPAWLPARGRGAAE